MAAQNIRDLTPTLETLSPAQMKQVMDGKLDVPCPQLSGSDIGPGTNVEVDDGNGHTLAASTLTAGHLLLSSPSGGTIDGCKYDFTTAVKNADFYKLTVGTHGEQTYTKQELARNNWAVDLSLGG